MVSLHSSTRNSSPSSDESNVFYFKMKGGFYRYIAEFATGDAKGKAAQSACVAYVEASKIAEKDLVVNHPVRLAMALNFSVFQSEVFENPDEASEMARVAFEDAITELDVKVIDVSVVAQRQIPMVQTFQKTMEIPQLHCIDKVVDDPVVQVPRVQVVEKIVEIPEIQTVQGTQV